MKTFHKNIAEYKSHLDEKCISIKLLNDTYNCDDVYCKSIQHCQDIDYLCRSIINYCLESSVLAIPVRQGQVLALDLAGCRQTSIWYCL